MDDYDCSPYRVRGTQVLAPGVLQIIHLLALPSTKVEKKQVVWVRGGGSVAA